MFRRLHRDQSGYSLVEVMVSILILTVAIIPMVSMFDAGLRSATTGSNYDKGRALAKKQLEQSQSLSYSTVKNNFPNAPCTFNGSGFCDSGPRTDADGEFPNFRFTIQKQYLTLNNDGTFSNIATDRGIMKFTVSVSWGGSNFNGTTYSATSLKTR